MTSSIRFQQLLIRLFAEDCLSGLADAVLFHQDLPPHQPDQRGFIRKYPDNTGTPFQLPVQPLNVVQCPEEEAHPFRKHHNGHSAFKTLVETSHLPTKRITDNRREPGPAYSWHPLPSIISLQHTGDADLHQGQRRQAGPAVCLRR